MTETGTPSGGNGRSIARLSDIRRHRPRSHFTFQWHVTARCDADCMHCYMKDAPDHKGQLEGELGLPECIKVLDDIEHFAEWHDVKVRLNITGGDPLLKEDIVHIIKEARERGFLVGMLGNPGHLDEAMASALKDAGIFRYQLSIDGMRATHDALRGRPGHFDDTLRAIRVLRGAGIPSVVMFTVSKRNAGELLDVIRLCADENVSIFDFSRLVPVGRGGGMEMVTAGEYRDLLMAVDAEYARLREKGCRTFFGRKEGLWALVEYERSGGPPPMREDVAVMTGCSVGSRSLTILADGTVYPCRRLPIPIGRVPDESVTDIFHGSQVLDGLRQVRGMEKCGPCALLKVCRGCMAVAAAASSGDPKAPDPQCWASFPKDGGKEKKGPITLEDFLFWRMKREGRVVKGGGGSGPKPKVFGCTVCDEGCGACAEACAACSEVCAGCNSPEG